MNIFEILGPVMVGPSSSHTAGAVRIGYISRQLLGEPVKDATLGLYRSGRGKRAAFIAECDQEIPAATIAAIRALEGIKKVSYLSLEETPCRTIQ